VAEETGIALTYCGSTYAVMMATPADLEDFAIGFSITEGIVERADEIDSIELIESDLGIEVRMWLDADRAQNLVARRRAIVGRWDAAYAASKALNRLEQRPVELEAK
jgi:FdhD protein